MFRARCVLFNGPFFDVFSIFFQRFIALTPLTLFIGMSSINLRKVRISHMAREHLMVTH